MDKDETEVMSGQVRIVVVDDHTLFRDGIKEMLSTYPAFVVVGEGGTGDEAVALAVEHRPDVLLLDVEMPGPGVLAVIRQVLRRSPGTALVVLTMHDGAEVVREILDSGAAAYLVKTVLREELVAAVNAVSRSSTSVLLSVPRKTIEQLDGRAVTSSPNPLTERELDVLRLAAEAFSNRQIASRLHITEATVKRHLTNIYAKLGAVSRIDAILRAATAKILPTSRFPSITEPPGVP